MTSCAIAQVVAGSLLPTAILTSDTFRILAAFVAINTIMYASVTVAKLLPRVNPSAPRRGRYQRAETRSIYPRRSALTDWPRAVRVPIR